MFRSLAIGALSFPFSLLGFVIGWAARDVRFGLLTGAVTFTGFFAASAVSLFFIRSYSYLDAVLPLIAAILWALALAPLSLGAGIFYAPASIGAAMLLGACMVIAKRYQMDKTWLLLPALVFIYEMLPINVPGPLDDTFTLTGSAGSALVQFLRRAIPKIIKTGIQGPGGSDN